MTEDGEARREVLREQIRDKLVEYLGTFELDDPPILTSYVVACGLIYPGGGRSWFTIHEANAFETLGVLEASSRYLQDKIQSERLAAE